MILYIASDHAGFELKEFLKSRVYGEKFSDISEVIDLGTHNSESCDYPIFANKLAEAIGDSENLGILICGTGIGMSMAANRHKNIRAALCINEEMAEMAQRHNNANVIVFGARVISQDTAVKCLIRFMSSNFEGGRHKKRLDLF